MRRWVVGCLVLALVLAGGTAVVFDGGGAPTGETTATAPTTDRSAGAAADRGVGGQSAGVAPAAEFDRTRFRIEVFANGSARWQFRYVRVLGTNDTARQQFEAFAERFNTEDTALYRDFVDRARALTSSAANATGRDMDARNFARDARVERDVEDLGIVEMSFTWTAFAAVDGDRVVVGDVFEGGLFLATDKSLQVVAGPGLRFASIDPDGTLNGGSLADSTTVTWQGERNFASGRPRVVLVPESGATTAPADATPRPANTTTVAVGGPATPSATPAASTTAVGPNRAGSTGGATPPIWLGVGALVVIVGAGAAVWARGVGGLGGTASAPSGPDDPGAAGDEGGADADAETGAAASGAAAVTPEELLSDEDRVVRMLEERGGRMRQVQIVEETDWSKSKVSMLLSDMEEEGTISKLRVGRENIVSLDGEEPAAAGSPFDDED